MKKLILALLLVIVCNCIYAQKSDLSQLQKDLASDKKMDWAPQLSLSDAQQKQLREMEISFFKKMNDIKQSQKDGKERSADMNRVFIWRDAEIVRILTPEQFKKYSIQREKGMKVMQARMDSLRKAQKPMPVRPAPKKN